MAIHLAATQQIPNLQGLIVLDVVEGSKKNVFSKTQWPCVGVARHCSGSATNDGSFHSNIPRVVQQHSRRGRVGFTKR